jgi:sporulation protein YabP
MPEIQMTHTLTLENQNKASLTGIASVESFNEKQVHMKTVSNTSITLCGENLTISKFNTENGQLVAEGKIIEIRYSENGTAGFIKKLFK